MLDGPRLLDGKVDTKSRLLVGPTVLGRVQKNNFRMWICRQLLLELVWATHSACCVRLIKGGTVLQGTSVTAMRAGSYTGPGVPSQQQQQQLMHTGRGSQYPSHNVQRGGQRPGLMNRTSGPQMRIAGSGLKVV